MRRVTIDSEALAARQALVYARHLAGESVGHTEYLCDVSAPVHVGKETRRNMRMPSLPVEHGRSCSVRFEGGEMRIRVTAKDASRLDVCISAPDYGAIDRFLDAAVRHCQAFAVAPRATDATRRYLYDSGYWERLADAPKRSPGSVFFTPDAMRVIEEVISFMTDPAVKERHRAHGVPYKLNVLLHGPPGTGKTSLIDTVAGQIGSDVFVVQFTARLRDTDLAMAMRRVSEHPNPVIVMEDVDCIFADRKAHDSSKNAVTLGGMLSALDGMSRPEGSVVFMTANKPELLDPAVIRSRRIDRIVAMTHATEEQTRAMAASFFRGEDVDEFCRGCEGKQYTTADLHDYLFRCAGKPCHEAFARAIREGSSLAGIPGAMCPMYL
jgi:hypothetical protein